MRSEVRLDLVVKQTSTAGGIKGMQYHFHKNAPLLPYNFARRVQKYAKVKAPKRTGHLAESIERKRLGANYHQVKVNAFYGIYVNYGTRYMHAQPFWEPAINLARAELRKDMKMVFHGEVPEVAV